MKKFKILQNSGHKFRTLFGLFVMGIGVILSNTINASAQSSIEREEIEKIVREYLIENPEILFEVQQAYEAKQALETSARQKENLDQNREFLMSSEYQIVFGDPNAAITVIEFFDYNCSFCKRAASDMQRLIDEDKNIRFVLKEFPVLGQESVEAARISMAFSTVFPEKHAEYHLKLLGMDGIKDGGRAMELAVEMGANEAEITQIIENPAIYDTIRQVYEVADGLGITGTPSYVVGDQVIFGAVGHAEIRSSIDGQAQ